MLDTLSEREAGVVAMRFGMTDGQPKTLDEIGKVYGVTRERIRQIESKTMSKLRHPSRSQVLRDYLDLKFLTSSSKMRSEARGVPPLQRLGALRGRSPRYASLLCRLGSVSLVLAHTEKALRDIGEPFLLLICGWSDGLRHRSA